MTLVLITFVLFANFLIICIDGKIVPSAVSTVDDNGHLISSTCHDSKDCEVTTTIPALSLACFNKVNKCHCFNTFDSAYHLDVVGDQCLMSKYGPCGTNHKNTFRIDCRDNFECINGRCCDPADLGRVVKGVYEFSVKSCDACNFDDDLKLECHENLEKEHGCLCKFIDDPDADGTFLDLRNYAGQNNCSVGDHGSCGFKNGVRIGCHGDNVKCVNGRCTNCAREKSEEV